MNGRYKPTGVQIGRAEPTGLFETLKNGKQRRKYAYKMYIPTKEGEIELEKWIRLAMEEIKESGMQELLDRIKEYCSRYGWLKKEKDLNEWALRCYYYDAYLHWEDFTVIWA